MGYLRTIFNTHYNGLPLDQQDVLEIASGHYKDHSDDPVLSRFGLPDTRPEGYDDRAINFQYILKTGQIPQVSYSDGLPYFEDDNLPYLPVYERQEWGSQYIDWSSDDAFTQALESIKSSVFRRVESSGELYGLLTSDHWNKDDRIEWEREVAYIVSEEVDKITGLDRYRVAAPELKYDQAERRATRLNDISADIENDTTDYEVDCETFSIVKGLILQQVDNYYLPPKASEGDYKAVTNYFYVSGVVSVNRQSSFGGHAYILSPVTLGVIEATIDPSEEGLEGPYFENVNPPDYSFEDFIRGEPAMYEDGSVYGAGHLTKGDLAQIRVAQGQLDTDKIYTSINPLMDWVDKTGNILEAGDIPMEIHQLRALKADIIALESQNGGQSMKASSSLLKPDNNPYEQYNQFVDLIVETGHIYNILDFIEKHSLVSSSSPSVQSATSDKPTNSIPSFDFLKNTP